MGGTVTGKTLLDLGYQPGAWFPAAIEAANTVLATGGSEADMRAAIDSKKPEPHLPLRVPGTLSYTLNIRAESPEEAANIASVEAHMRELMRVPTVRAAAVMPDACSAGREAGTIPVGGVVATENAIHPGMHSADICCSMAVTVFADANPTAILDAGMTLSHFGGGGRPRGEQIKPHTDILAAFEANSLLKPWMSAAIEHHATQGDGNHFFYVGRMASSGQIALVTHHGSRKPGAMLYKAGMAIAEKTRRALSPETPEHNAWIVADSTEGETYWSALQTIRAWTKSNHYALHDRVAEALGLSPVDRFWNEHNFVFRRADGLFYHGKGATPAWADYAADASGLTLIPLNLAEPVLIARGRDAANGLGFSPHGAGRNFSRSAYIRQVVGMTAEELIARDAPGIDVRYFSGRPDLSELPSAYKNAATVRQQIAEYGLADIVDTIKPIGSIMAGDWQQDAPWRQKKAAKAEANRGTQQ